MKKTLIIAILTGCIPFLSPGQAAVEEILKQVEQNNPALAAFRQAVVAEKLGNRTGLALPNPEVTFDYLWGNPSGVGNRIDFAISQPFEFPTSYALRSQLVRDNDSLISLTYQKQRIEIMHQTRLICAEIIFRNALNAEYHSQVQQAERLNQLYQQKLSSGETGILEYNKVKLILLGTQQKFLRNQMDTHALLRELEGLNGGMAVTLPDSIFPETELPPAFDQWYAAVEKANPDILRLEMERSAARKQERLAFSQSLPGFTVGYMSESIVGTTYRGISGGISLPLWENANRVKQAKARTMEIVRLETEIKSRFYSRMKALYERTITMHHTMKEFSTTLSSLSDPRFLQKALESGQISISEYYVERALFNQSREELIEMHYRHYLDMAELSKYLVN